jgi:omega-hydroxy-beta-dihydromenaquinone-9 sulfotransferase
VDAEPVFIVGCGRSGTTVVYEALARHSDAVWFSTWTDRTRRPELAAFNWLFKHGWHTQRWGPRPSEGYRVWDAALALPESVKEARLGATYATPQIVRRVRRQVDRHRRFGGGSVFVNKNTRNSRRVPLLHALSPGARFIHVLRSPLDTVSSMLEVQWWNELPLRRKQGVAPQPPSDGPVAEARLAAELWVSDVSAVLDARPGLAKDRYMEIRYEDLVRSPAPVVARLLEWLGLEREGVDRLVRGVSKTSVGAHRRRLSSDQIRVAWTTVEACATRLEYGR